jgi:putative DNA primase/helicase
MDNPLDAFAPLTEAELADPARQVPQDLEADSPKPTCPPSEAENGVLAAAQLYSRKPDSSWRYETAEGETAFYVVRWNEGDKKVIRPLSWFDGEGWKFGAWANNRPLYNLAAITEQPNAPIIICEGEKAAEAAARIFPKSITTTSSGGWRRGENRLVAARQSARSHLARQRCGGRQIRARSGRDARDV